MRHAIGSDKKGGDERWRRENDGTRNERRRKRRGNDGLDEEGR